MKTDPWDQKLARVLVRPLVKTPITPNQLTIFNILVALAGCWLIATGSSGAVAWGASLFALSRFLDHFDGELARQSGKTSKLGYYLDYVAGGVSFGALFLSMGIGFSHGLLGGWAILLGAAGTFSAVISVFLNLGIDKASKFEDGEAIGYPALGGFELEDGIYLLVPVAWFGWLEYFFIAAGIGASVYTVWTLLNLLRLRRKTGIS
jgi:phosphatidylglycerophosphate synthase